LSSTTPRSRSSTGLRELLQVARPRLPFRIVRAGGVVSGLPQSVGSLALNAVGDPSGSGSVGASCLLGKNRCYAPSKPREVNHHEAPSRDCRVVCFCGCGDSGCGRPIRRAQGQECWVSKWWVREQQILLRSQRRCAAVSFQVTRFRSVRRMFRARGPHSLSRLDISRV
jgi:hypothetical protein